MASSNIFAQYLQPAKSVTDYSNDYAKADALRTQNAIQSLTLQQAAAQKNALRQAVSSGQIDLNSDSGGAQAVALAPDVAPGLLKTVQEGKTSAATATKDIAQAGNFNADAAKTNVATAHAKADQAITDVTNLNTPQDALTSLVGHYKAGDIDANKFQAVYSTLAPSITDPTQFGMWKRQMVMGIMDAKDRIAATAPKISMANAGGSLIPVNENADAGPVGAVAGSAPIPITQSADNVANNATSRANVAAQQAGENARAAQSRSAQFKLAGLDASGNMPTSVPGGPGAPNSSPIQGLVDAVGTGQVSQETALSRMPPAMKGTFSILLAQKYPDFDPTAFGSKVHAARDFLDGPLGNQMRSNATAQAHLDQLTQLAAALNNGDVRVINTIANAYGVQTGQPGPQVFNAVRNIVGQEVVKAIVSGGGGEGERKDAASAFDPGSSSQQFLQTVGAVKHVMSAQNDNLLAQRRAAGLKDSSLPNYNGNSAAPGTPAGWSYVGKVGQ